MSNPQQILVIHGGTTFENDEAYLASLHALAIDLARLRKQRDWKECLQEVLGSSYDVLRPTMPNGSNARYSEWKIFFEKILEQVDDGIDIVGHSLGALFLAKYFSEGESPRAVRRLFLVAGPFDAASGELLGSFSLDANRVASMQNRVESIFLYYSADDATVPISEADKYFQKLPMAKLRIFNNRGHFKQETFPELIADITSR